MMNEGLLWYDNQPRRGLVETIRQAAGRFEARFGRYPTVCYLNAADVEGQMPEVGGMLLQTAPHVLRHHLWLGVENNHPLE